MLARQGRMAEAVEQLNEALRLNPNSAEAHNNLGVVLLRSGKGRREHSAFLGRHTAKARVGRLSRDNLKRAQTQINTRR